MSFQNGNDREGPECRTAERGTRLQVFLAHSGVASRRASEKLILAGRAQINNRIVTRLGEKVYAGDAVLLDGVPVVREKRRQYWALHKPPYYLCSASDPQGRKLALELLPQDIHERLYTIGRLDYRSSGLILLTNDGSFAAMIGHPSAEIEKEYLVEASGSVPEDFITAFCRGVTIEGIVYKARRIERLGTRRLRILLIEGKNREIRRVFSHFHLHPAKLRRIRVGPVRMDGLEEGAARPLTPRELGQLRECRAGGKHPW